VFRLIELLKQKQGNPLHVNVQVLLIFSGMQGFLDPLTLRQVATYKKDIAKLWYNTNISKNFVNTKPINNKVFDILCTRVQSSIMR